MRVGSRSSLSRPGPATLANSSGQRIPGPDRGRDSARPRSRSPDREPRPGRPRRFLRVPRCRDCRIEARGPARRRIPAGRGRRPPVRETPGTAAAHLRPATVPTPRIEYLRSAARHAPFGFAASGAARSRLGVRPAAAVPPAPLAGSRTPALPPGVLASDSIAVLTRIGSSRRRPVRGRGPARCGPATGSSIPARPTRRSPFVPVSGLPASPTLSRLTI